MHNYITPARACQSNCVTNALQTTVLRYNSVTQLCQHTHPMRTNGRVNIIRPRTMHGRGDITRMRSVWTMRNGTVNVPTVPFACVSFNHVRGCVCCGSRSYSIVRLWRVAFAFGPWINDDVVTINVRGDPFQQCGVFGFRAVPRVRSATVRPFGACRFGHCRHRRVRCDHPSIDDGHVHCAREPTRPTRVTRPVVVNVVSPAIIRDRDCVVRQLRDRDGVPFRFVCHCINPRLCAVANGCIPR